MVRDTAQPVKALAAKPNNPTDPRDPEGGRRESTSKLLWGSDWWLNMVEYKWKFREWLLTWPLLGAQHITSVTSMNFS